MTRRARRNGIAVPARVRKDGTLPESRFLTRVVTLAAFYGWLVFHAPAGGKDGAYDGEQRGAGFPDLVLVRADEVRAELLFAELKAPPDGQTPSQRQAWLRRHWRPNQRQWLAQLQAVGLSVDYLLSCSAVAPADLDHAPPHVEAYLWCWPDDYDALHDRLARGRARIEPAWSPLLEQPKAA